MLIVGARGFAIQLFEVIEQLGISSNCTLFDDTSKEPMKFHLQFPVIRDIQLAKSYLQNEDNRFVLGTGNPKVRKYFFNLFKNENSYAETIISPFAHIGKYNVSIGTGSCILTNAVIESTAQIGLGALVNLNVTITHGCVIGNFCEICPGAHISGDCTIGENTFIGTGAVILPKLKIGSNVIVGAGAVVTKDIPSGTVVKGNPGRF